MSLILSFDISPELSHQALVRDDYRCVVTGYYDSSSCESNQVYCRGSRRQMLTLYSPKLLISSPSLRTKELAETTKTTQRYGFLFYFMTELLNLRIIKHEYATSAWAVIERFGNVSIISELNGVAIHRLENIMTMDITLHALFDKLCIWFEETVGKIFSPQGQATEFYSFASQRHTRIPCAPHGLCIYRVFHLTFFSPLRFLGSHFRTLATSVCTPHVLKLRIFLEQESILRPS